jgi:hypothetical protein
MATLLWLVLAGASLAMIGAFAYLMRKPGLGAGDLKERAWDEFRAVAADVGGLEVVSNEDGWPRLAGSVEGIAVEIDCDNHVSSGLEGLLGLRCRVPDGDVAPNAALWIGDLDALRTQFGRPRPSGDSDGLFEVYTRVEPSASDWWQDPALHDALTILPGAGVVLLDGQLMVLFARLDVESVRAALRIPGLVRQGAQRVTLH